MEISNRKKIAGLAGVLAILAAIAIAITSTQAVFTSSVSNPNNIFTTGTVIINQSPAEAAVSMSNMAPGDVEFGEITVSNAGNLQLRYAAVLFTGTSLLNEELDFDVKAGLASCDATGWGAGEVLNAAGTKFTSGNLFGSTAQGSQAGDRVLNAGASEKLCFRVALPLATDNTMQNASADGWIIFAAEQTANN